MASSSHVLQNESHPLEGLSKGPWPVSFRKMRPDLLTSFIIQLDRIPERVQHVKEHLMSMAPCGHVVHAVDAQSNDIEDYLDAYPEVRIRWTWPHSSFRGQLGCYLSHIEVWRQMVETKQPWALVIEDDVLLPDDFDAVLTTLFKCLPEDFELVALGVGTTGYVISLPCAQKLLQSCQVVRAPIDVTLGSFNLSPHYRLEILGSIGQMHQNDTEAEIQSDIYVSPKFSPETFLDR